MCDHKANNNSKASRFEKYNTLWRTNLNTDVAHSVLGPATYEHTQLDTEISRANEDRPCADVFEIYQYCSKIITTWRG